MSSRCFVCEAEGTVDEGGPVARAVVFGAAIGACIKDLAPYLCGDHEPLYRSAIDSLAEGGE